MDNIILFLALFSLTATAAQVSLFRHWWQQLALALAIAGITYAFFPRAIQFSSTDIEALLANADAMLDMSVVLVLEAVLMLILALFMLREMYSVIAFPWRAVLWLQYLPMVSAVGVLCFYQVHVYQQGLQLDFDKIALVYGGGVAVAVVVPSAVKPRVTESDVPAQSDVLATSVLLAIPVIASEPPIIALCPTFIPP